MRPLPSLRYIGPIPAIAIPSIVARDRALGAAVPPEALVPLARYASLVLEWGARINLTGARTPEALADDHLADALALLRFLPPGAFSFVDVGSGAGLPGLVLALLRPDAAGTLLEPIGKKHAFLAHAIRTLGLTGRVAARAERLTVMLLITTTRASPAGVKRETIATFSERARRIARRPAAVTFRRIVALPAVVNEWRTDAISTGFAALARADFGALGV